MGDKFVLIEASEGIGWITLNDPERLNPVTGERIAELNEACRVMSGREDVKVVVVTGAGRGFCSGADLSQVLLSGRREAPSGVPRPGSDSLLGTGPGMWTLSAMRQPVIAMVNGPAVGYGAELAIQADIRIVGESALFRLPFAKLGVVSDTGAGSWLLPRLIGWSRAAELLYTARFVGADEALRIGLANHVVPDNQLREFTTACANEIAANSAWAVSNMKQLIFGGLDDSKQAHLMDQYWRFRHRDEDTDIEAYAARFRKDRSDEDC